MRARTLLLLLLLVLVATFAMINWTAFVAPTQLSLVFTTIEAPLGVVMLGILAGLVIVFLVYVVYMQSTVLLEGRRHSKELKEQRALADQAEASRFTELREYLAAELKAVHGEIGTLESRVLTRLDQIEERGRASVEQAGNTLAAYIGELEDRLGPGPAPESPTGAR